MSKIRNILADKSKMRKFSRGAYLLLVLIILIISFSASSKKANKFVVGLEVEIKALDTGNRLIDSTDVFKIVEEAFGSRLIGKKISEFDEGRLERVISEYPMVSNAEVYINAQDKIKVEIEQKQPLFRVIADNGLNYYMDNQGARIPLSKHVTERLLVFTGNIPPHIPDFMDEGPEMLQDIFELGQLIRADEFFNPMIEQVDVRGRSFVLIPKIGRQKIRFGTIEDAESKLNRLKRYYKEVAATRAWNQYKTIDVRFYKQVVCEK